MRETRRSNFICRARAALALATISILGFAKPAGAATETVLHAFGKGDDGTLPEASLLDVNGTLYGTALEGGNPALNGTVFSITSKGIEHVLHSFTGGDGEWPSASLTDVKGTLYGTTQYGGAYRLGSLFSITPGGVETVLHSFAGGGDGAYPQAALLSVNGTLYSTTAGGGVHGLGMVFSYNPVTGAEKVIYAFAGGKDGAYPTASLIDVNGTLYGTTQRGGAARTCKVQIMSGCGTVFSINRDGVERVLHVFRDGTDGANPSAGLIDVNGTLYGTTVYGGTYDCYADGCGTVFSITPRGVKKSVHIFTEKDGTWPSSGLIKLKGTLYGTTANGVVFSINPVTGVETSIYSFTTASNGAGPSGGLIDVNGTLYGTTRYGGGENCTGGEGCGTVFAIKP